MATPVIAEMTYVWQREGRFPGELGLYAAPTIQFLDLGGRLTSIDKAIKRTQTRAVDAHRRAISTHRNSGRRFWFAVEEQLRRNEARLIRRAVRHTAKLLERQHEQAQLKMAWPSSSSDFSEPTSATKVRDMLAELLTSSNVWFQVHPQLAA